MTRKINVLMPEPITLMDDDSSGDARSPTSSLRSLNQNFTFQRAHVSDCTIVNGENGSKFAVWKVTLIMQPTGHDSYHPSVAIYKRYSDFFHFREDLVRQCQNAHLSTLDLPRLPPRVKWYDSWRYQDVNLNNVWLAKRRQGLDYFLNKVLLNQELVAAARDLILAFLERQPTGNGL